MPSRFVSIVAVALFALFAFACTLAGNAAPAAQPTALPTAAATAPPLAPETVIPTSLPPTGAATNTLAATATLSATNTPTPTLTLAPPTATTSPKSSGPLSFNVVIAQCRLDPSREGGVILTMRFEATGGNGVYTYYREDQKVARTFDRPATKGAAVIDAYRVTSGDGQSLEQKFRFTGSQFGCP